MAWASGRGLRPDFGRADRCGPDPGWRAAGPGWRASDPGRPESRRPDSRPSEPGRADLGSLCLAPDSGGPNPAGPNPAQPSGAGPPGAGPSSDAGPPGTGPSADDWSPRTGLPGAGRRVVAPLKARSVAGRPRIVRLERGMSGTGSGYVGDAGISGPGTVGSGMVVFYLVLVTVCRFTRSGAQPGVLRPAGCRPPAEGMPGLARSFKL